MRFQLSKWIDTNKLVPATLSRNKRAVQFLQKNPRYIDWDELCSNPKARKLILKNRNKINWKNLSVNQNAIDLLEENLEKIPDWDLFCCNPEIGSILEPLMYGEYGRRLNWSELSANPSAYPILKENPRLIDWEYFSANSKAIKWLERNIEEYGPNESSVNWEYLSENPSAVHILEKYPEKIDWVGFSCNKNTVPILKKDLEEFGVEKTHICWNYVAKNRNAMEIIEIGRKHGKINWEHLSENRNKKAVDLLKENSSKIFWYTFSENPEIFELEI